MRPPEMSDSDLLSELALGEGRAIAAVRGWIRPIVAHYGWRFDDAEALAQDILLRILEIGRGHRFQGRSSLKTFVRRVATNTCINQHKEERRRRRIEKNPLPAQDPAGNERPDKDFQEAEHRRLALEVRQRLSRECRELFEFVFDERLSSQDIGRKLGITDGNVRVRTHRCIERARSIWGDLHSRFGRPQLLSRPVGSV